MVKNRSSQSQARWKTAINTYLADSVIKFLIQTCAGCVSLRLCHIKWKPIFSSVTGGEKKTNLSLLADARATPS